MCPVLNVRLELHVVYKMTSFFFRRTDDSDVDIMAGKITEKSGWRVIFKTPHSACLVCLYISHSVTASLHSIERTRGWSPHTRSSSRHLSFVFIRDRRSSRTGGPEGELRRLGPWSFCFFLRVFFYFFEGKKHPKNPKKNISPSNLAAATSTASDQDASCSTFPRSQLVDQTVLYTRAIPHVGYFL